jgi:exopolysaccharide biosynthesis protein
MKKIKLIIFVLITNFALGQVYTHPPKGGVRELVHKSNKCIIRKKIQNNGEIFIIKIFKNKMNYKVNTNNGGIVDFYLNSNFFEPTSPIGEVIVNGKVVNNKVKRGGYFTSNGGEPTISLYNRPNSLYSTQTKYITIKNGTLNKSMFVSRLSKLKTYRTLLGEDKNGNLILIHSGINGLLSVEDITRIGKSEGMITSLMFDGGSSIEVLLKDGTFKHKYHSVSDIDKKRFKIHKPFVYITGAFK